MAKIDDYKPATGVGRFSVKLVGDELRIKMRVFIDSALKAEDLAKFTLQAEPIVKQHWENRFGFKCSNAAYPHTYKPVFKIVYETGPGTAHWVMTMTDGVTASVSRENWWKTDKQGLTNAPKSVKMRPDAASDKDVIKGALGGQVLDSLRSSFPFYADAPGGALSPHARDQLKTLGKQITKLDPAAVLTVTAYGSNKGVALNAAMDLLQAAGVANVLKRKSKRTFSKSINPKTGSTSYVKVLLKQGLGQADPSTVGLFSYPATIVHEFGHMLGLVDEYNCLSKEAADKMAELDFIHPSESTLFQDFHTPGAGEAGESKQSQAVLAGYCKEVGCEPAQYGTRTISIMSNGSKFYPRHFVTLWAAIVELTKGTTTAKDWSIVKL
jgi:hypothetical protein